MFRIAAIALTLLFTSNILHAQEARLLRFPTWQGEKVAFTYAGNLYTVASKGGVARRLTSHEGNEMFPRYSPDGKWLAFTGQYDGNTEVYVMPADGGVPKRLTYTATLGRDEVSDRMGPNNIVMGWHPDSKRVLFRTRGTSFNDFIGELYLVDLEGHLPEQLPLPRGGFGSYSADGKQFVYNRIFREFRTWKRYRGGMADDVWLYDFASKKTTNLTNNGALDTIPMFHKSGIYFLSDRDEAQKVNLYKTDVSGKAAEKVTNFTEFDIKFPSVSDTGIIFENGGYLHTFDPANSQTTKLTINIQEDFGSGRGSRVNAKESITNFEISPDGKRALFGSRGDVFTVPAQNGVTRNLTATPGTHERNSKWSPDGKHIAYISDATGEDEIYILPQAGGKAVQLTSGGNNYKYEVRWSPDSKKIAWSDRAQRLQFVEVESKAVKQVDKSDLFEMRDYTWSPDSKWLAYSKGEVGSFPRIFLHSLETGKSTAVSDSFYGSNFPAFSQDGKYFFFQSARDFNPTYGQTEFNHIYTNLNRLYVVPLSKSTPSPFQPKNDEVTIAEKKEEKKPEEKKPEVAKSTDLKIDLDGFMDRVLGLPVAPSNYFNLDTFGSTLYYNRSGQICSIDMAAPSIKETVHGPGNGFEISGDGKKMMLSRDGNYYIIDTPKGPIAPGGEALKTDGMVITLDRQAEWKQMFHESWRQMRDFFYDPNLHGVDWLAVRKKYEPLVEHVNHRADLSYIVGEMISELNCGHAYVGGGELPKVNKVQQGLLGARLEHDKASGAVKVARILQGGNWSARLRSPLTEIGVDVKEGDYILAINGKPTKEMVNPYIALFGTVGTQVVLKVNKEAKEEGSREVTVVPIADESNLAYFDWVESNRKKVEKATDGKVGYLHIPDMLQTGLNEFTRQYYPQTGKKALIIDDRGNGGGNVSPQITERLRREMVMVDISRNGAPQTNPSGMHLGPKCMLINEYSASDGDIFPYRFRAYGLGKLIGKRTWGGVVGIRGTLPLLDGGVLNRPEFSRYDKDGKEWVMEGVGVEPDIILDNDPAQEFAGKDAQLEKAIALMLEELKKNPKEVPPPPKYPIKK